MATVGACTTLTVVVVASGVAGPPEVEEDAVEGTAVAGVVFEDVSVVGVVVADDAVLDADPDAVSVAAAEAAAPAAARSAFVTCGRNGSLVWKTSNETSWPP